MEVYLVAFNVSHISWKALQISITERIEDPDLAYTAGLGFATVGANNGHNGTSGLVSHQSFNDAQTQLTKPRLSTRTLMSSMTLRTAACTLEWLSEKKSPKSTTEKLTRNRTILDAQPEVAKGSKPFKAIRMTSMELWLELQRSISPT